MLKKISIGWIALGFLMMHTLCLAEQKEWINSDTYSWLDDAHWNPHGTPEKGDDVYVYKGHPLIRDGDSGEAKSVNLLGENGTYGSLTVGGDGTGVLYVVEDINIGANGQGGELNISHLGLVSCHSFIVDSPGKFILNGGTLEVEGGIFNWPGDNLTIQGNEYEYPSMLILNGFTSSSIVYDQVRIGYDAWQQGQLTIMNGTDFEANPAVGVGSSSYGTILVTGSGSSWSWGGGSAVIGGSGQAEIIMEKGGHWSVDSLSSDLNLAADTGSKAEITVRGGSSKWEVYNDYSYDVVLGKTGTASLLVKDGGMAVITGTLRCTGTGIITVRGSTDSVGRLEVANLILETGSSLSGGGGTIKGSVTSSGRLSPGSSAGAMTIEGDITLQSDGTLKIELGGTTQGTEYDVLNVTGKATLSGTLDVELINGFSPKEGDTFQIINFGTQSGCFETIHLPSLDTGLSWDTDSLCTTGTINVVLGDNPSIPTLNEWGLILFSVLLLGLSLLILQRRKNARSW